MWPDTTPATYLIDLSRESIMRAFYERGNAPMEYSLLRSMLVAQGIEAKHDNHWGLMASALVRSRVLESVGRGVAAVASRHSARNNIYRLTVGWWGVAAQYAANRGWVRVDIPPAPTTPPAEQTSLV